MAIVVADPAPFRRCGKGRRKNTGTAACQFTSSAIERIFLVMEEVLEHMAEIRLLSIFASVALLVCAACASLPDSPARQYEVLCSTTAGSQRPRKKSATSRYSP